MNFVVESNAVLKQKFQKQQLMVVNSVSMEIAKIIDFLYQERVIDDEGMSRLHAQRDPQQQCRNLLGLLHTSKHPQAFVQMYRAMKDEPDLQWLVDRIDSDQSMISVPQEQRYVSDPTGKCLASMVCNY